MTIVRTVLLMYAAAACYAQEPLKLGIIGLDTPHAVRLSELLNVPSRKDHVREAIQ